MPDYKTLYHKTFRTITDVGHLIHEASALLISARLDIEEALMNSDEAPTENDPA